MKKVITFLFVLSVAVYFGANAAYAQGKGPSFHGAGQGHGPETIHSGDHAGPKTATKPDNDHETGKQTRDARKDETASEKIVASINNNPQVKAQVQNLLPTGVDLKTAAMGFRNRGQMIAALHVHKNLNIPWDQLKAKMTGDPPMSLGKAIQALRPDLTEKQSVEEAEKAEKQAKETEKTVKPTT